MYVEGIAEVFPSIHYAILCNAFGKLDEFVGYGNKTAHEEQYSCFFDALGTAADFFDCYYHEKYEENTLYVSFESMMEYYRLCRVYSRFHRVSLKENPFMKEAMKAVEFRMDLGSFGGYGIYLQTKVNHKWASGIVIDLDENYFHEEFELAEAVFEVGAWYERAVYRLRRTLIEDGALHLPALPAHQGGTE